MSKARKTTFSTILLAMVLFQGIFFYYYTCGLEKLLFLTPYALIGSILTIFLLAKLIKYRSTTSLYHIIAITLVIVMGCFTSLRGNSPMEYLDWKLRRSERNQIVADVKNGLLKPNSSLNNGICHLSRNSILPISNGGDDIWIKENTNGLLHVEFFIDRGFIDHYSALVYTNDSTIIHNLKHGISGFNMVVKKLDNNWYRIAY